MLVQLIEEVTRNKKLQRFKAIMAAWQRVLPEMFPSMKVRCIHAAFALPKSLVMQLEQFWRLLLVTCSSEEIIALSQCYCCCACSCSCRCSSSSAPWLDSFPSSVLLTG